MARKPADRHATAAELQAELDEFLAEQGSNARNRDIGGAVAELFADVRADTRRVIDQQFKKVTALTAREYQSFRPLELASTMFTGERSNQTRGTIASPQANTRRIVIGAALLLGLLAIAFGWSRSGGREKLETKSAPAPSATP
ncbi:MAG TPA: hypothetical protein VMS65_16690, partial [Polyangiaceae bacterium]|nr:hypothetical protein [Polyangiaceae bacterium]